MFNLHSVWFHGFDDVELAPTSTFALSFPARHSSGPSISLSAVKYSNCMLSKNILLIYTYTSYFITFLFTVNAVFPVG